MKQVRKLQNNEQIKALADVRRMEILRLLMTQPATLTQLAQTLGQSPAWVRHHMLALEAANLVELAEIRTVGKVTEKFYRAKAGAFLIQEIVLPKGGKPTVVFSGSHDLALEQVSEQIANHINLLIMPVGSLDGLVNLRLGLCQVSGAHLVSTEGEYNTPFVRHLFPDRSMEMVTLAYRTLGLMFAPGNPKDIGGLQDLAQPGLRFINRNPGSGTRLWLDAEFKRLGIEPEAIEGYEVSVSTHTQCAFAVAQGHADAAFGLQASARQQKLDFLPLRQERYDLVLSHDMEESLSPLLDYLQTSAFRRSLQALTGYDSFHTGEQLYV